MQRRSMILISLLLWHGAASCAEPIAKAMLSAHEDDAKQILVLNAGAQACMLPAAKAQQNAIAIGPTLV